MPLTVVFSRRADAQLRSLRRYVAARSSPAIADQFTAAIAQRCRGIGTLPEGGNPRDDLGTGFRSVPFRRNTTIVYHLREDTVVIAGIFYGGQDLGRHFPRRSG